MAGSGITLQITAEDAEFLASRGGISHRGKAAFSRSLVLGRMLATLRLFLEFSDPRQTRGLPEELHALILRLLPEPWTLRRFEIRNLEGVLECIPGFAPEVEAAGVDPASLLAAIGAMNATEKLVLVDQAVVHQAPAAARLSLPHDPDDHRP